MMLMRLSQSTERSKINNKKKKKKGQMNCIGEVISRDGAFQSFTFYRRMPR